MVSSEIWLNILQKSPIPLAVFGFGDNRFPLLFSNEAYLTLLGLKDSETNDKSVSELFNLHGIHVSGEFLTGIIHSFETVQESGLPDRINNVTMSVNYKDSIVPQTFNIDVENTPIEVNGIVKYICQSLFQHQSSGVPLQLLNPVSEPGNRAVLIETILQNLPIGIAVNKIDTGEATLVNRQFSETYGWSEKDLVDIKSFFEKVYPEPVYREHILNKVMDDINSRDEGRMQWPNVEVTTSTGEKRIINAKNIPLFDQNLMISTVVDITVQAKQAAEIRRAKLNQDALINSSEDLMWSVDINCKLITANKAFLRNLKHATGRDLREGDSILDNVYGEEVNKKWKSYYDRALRGEGFSIKDDYFNPEEDRFNYSLVSFSPMYNEQGEVFGAACYSKDTTHDTLALFDLQKARNETQKIMESSLDVICTVDVNGCFVNVSAASLKIWGYTAGELVGRPYIEFVYPEDIALTIEASRNIMGGTAMTNFENRYVKKDGSLVSIIWSARWDDTDKIMYCIAKDATERNRAEDALKRSERRYRSLVENGADVVMILDPGCKPLYVSPSTTRVLGYNEDEAMSFSLNELVHPADQAAWTAKIKESMESPGQPIGEHISRLKHKDGSWRWLETTLTNMIHDPMINGIVDNFRDVTKRMEAELEKNLLISNTEESFVLLNRKLEIVSFNDQFEKLYKNYFNTIVRKGQSILDYAQPERRSAVAEIYSRVLQGKSVIAEIQLSDPASSEIMVFSINYKPAKNSEAEIIGAFVTAINITESQKVFDQLTESEKRYKLLFQSSPLPNFVYDLTNFQILDVNDTACEHYGYSKAELFSMSILDITTEQEGKRIVGLHQHTLLTENVVNFGIFLQQKKDGGLIQSDISGYKINFDGRECVMIACNDVTERELAFQRIKENESKLLAAQKIAKVGYWQSFPDSKGLYWSDEVYNIWGLDKITFHLDYDSYFNTIHPDDREEFLKSRERAFKTGVQHDIEHRIMLKDGSMKWVHTLGNLVRDEQGEIMIFEGTVQDITNDKLALEKLKISEARYEYVTRATSDAIWDWDLLTDEVYYGGAFQTLFGYPADIARNHSTFWENHIHPEDAKKTHEKIQSIIIGDTETWTLEYRFRKSDGKYAFVEDKGILIKDESGNPIKMVGAMHDISEARIGERQESLQRETSRLFNQPDVHLNDILSQVLQHILSYGDICVAEIWLPESDNKHLKLGARHTKGKQFDIFCEESFGVKSFLSGEGLPGKVWQTSKIEYWDDIDTDLNFLRNAAAKKAALKSAIGLPLIYNDEFIGVLVLCLQEKGEYLLEYGTFRDSFCQHLSSEIKRKQLDQELKQIFSFAPDVISVAGTDGYFKKINPAACEMLEYTEQELLSLPVTAFIHPDDLEVTGQVIKSLDSRADTFYFENRYITKTGKIIWLAWTSTPSPEEGLVLAVAKDITDKKKLEVLLEKSNILAEMGGWEVDVQNKSIYWSSVTKTIHEVEPGFQPDLDSALNFYPEGFSRDTIRNAVEQSTIDGTPWDIELQIVTAKGNIRWVRANGEAEFVNGKCVKLYGSFQNITHRKVAEIELLKIYEEKNTILESIQDGFYALDKNWIVTYWNHEAENLLSLKRADIVNKNLWEVFENTVDLKFYSEYHRAVSENVPVRFEEYFAPVNGWFEVSAFPSDEGLTVYFRDVTNRKNTELELLQFKKIIDNSRDGIAIVDLNGKATYLNPAFAEVLGYDPAIHHHPDSIYANRRLVGQVFDTLLSGKYWQGDVEVKTKRGEIVSYYLSGGPVFDEDGQLKAVYGIHTDITERKQAEAKIRKAYHERNTILESIGDGFFAVDKVGTVTYWNREAEKLLGITKKQAVGHHLEEVFAKMVDSSAHQKYYEAIETNQVVHFEDYYLSLHKWHEVSAYPSADGLSVFFKDITERKIYDIQVRELNRVLKTKVKELAVSNRELEQFAYVASHDLQEPLRMITSFLTQLQRKYDNQLDAKAHQYIYFAVDGAKRMRQIILDLLDFSRVGRVEAEAELVNLNEVINEILILFRKNIEDTKALFILSKLPSISVPTANIRQLLQNLISNAIKYHSVERTPLVEIGYSETPEYWEIWVKDNGIGISSDYFEKIFIIFQRLHTKEEFSGTGMGLAICRKIVENLGGKLWVESEEGSGSSFFFTIPKTANREIKPQRLF